MNVWLIRHGETQGNRERRYIGSTDEPLNEQGVRQAYAFASPTVDRLFVSPMQRCRETADILFPDMPSSVCQDLRECDFGVFEGKNADALANSAAYRAWVAGGCKEDIPGGEGVSAFKKRCCDAFLSAIASASDSDTLAFVIHGGCIMAILERYEGNRAFYEYHIRNCEGVLCEVIDGNRLRIAGGALC